MKEKYIFDDLEDDIKEIDAMTVIKETGVNTERISEKVMSTINAEKKTAGKKKGFKKRIGFTLVAAAAVVAVLGTVSAGAAGSFNTFLGERFAGESFNGLYNGGDVRVSADEAIEPEFIGIAGDEQHVIAAIKLTKKDGTAFAEDFKNCYIEPVDLNDTEIVLEPQSKDGCFDTGNWDSVDVTQSAWSKMLQEVKTGSGSQEYRFIDEKTINCFLSYRAMRNLKGETMTFQQPTIYIYHIDEVLFPLSKSEYTEQEITDRTKEKAAALKDNQVIRYFAENNSYAVATKSAVTVDLSASAKLNYKDNSSVIEGKDSLTFKGVDYDIKDAKVTAFGMKLTIDVDSNGAYDALDYMDEEETFGNKFLDAFMGADNAPVEKITLTLENGTKVFTKAGQLSGNSSNNGEKIRYEVEYQFMDKNGSWITINPQEVKSVQLEDTVITK